MRDPGRAVAIVALAAVGGLSLLAPGAEATPRVKVPLPAAGQTTVVVTQLRYSGDAAPKRMKPKLPNRAKLGPDERGIYATYRKRRGSTTALTFVSLLLRRTATAADFTRPTPAPLAGAFEENFLGVELGLFFIQSHFIDDEAIDREEARREDEAKLLSLIQVIGDDAPIEPAPRMDGVLEYGGVVEPPAAHAGKLGASLVDTGHYDDGHSFGWSNAGTRPAIGDWLRLSADNAPYEELIEKIERRMTEDLNGDGEVGAGGSGGGKIDTEVGIPVIH